MNVDSSRFRLIGFGGEIAARRPDGTISNHLDETRRATSRRRSPEPPTPTSYPPTPKRHNPISMSETAPTAEQERNSNSFSSFFFLICLLVSGICFFYGITGTQEYQQATKPIQEVELGDRVVGTNPQLSDGQREVDPVDHRR